MIADLNDAGMIQWKGKLVVSAIGVCLTGLLLSFSEGDDPLKDLLANFNLFQQNYPQEKIYVQFDRERYSEKDTIYFKAYILNAAGSKQVVSSNILHVDIADMNNSIVQTFRYPASNGQAWGSIAVADAMKTGEWRFRAYTNWMRNFDQAYFFKKDIIIGQQPAAAAAPGNTVTFHPEGGQLVNGLFTKIGYRSVNANGTGIAVKGWVADQQGNKVAAMETGVVGVGHFEMTPVTGKQYIATLQYADGSEKKIPLPNIAAEGYQLRVENDNDEHLVVKINRSAAAVNKPVVLVAQSNNSIQYAAKADLTAKGIVSSLSAARFPTGILQLVLFDAAFKPVAERLVYIDHHDQLQLKITPDKSVYAKKEETQLIIEAADESGIPVDGTFSVSVTPVIANGADDDGQDIVSRFLLSADIKEPIHNASFYFSGTGNRQKTALDDLLLTTAWKKFSWKDIIAKNFAPLPFQPEESLQLSGKVQTADGKPVSGARVTCILQKGNLSADTLSDKNGVFKFDKLFVQNASAYTVFAKHPDGVSNLVIFIDSVPAVQPYYKDIEPINVSADTAANKSRVRLGFSPLPGFAAAQPGAKVLQEVVVREKKTTLKELATQSSLNLNGPGQADQVLTFKDLELCHELANCLFGKLVGVELKKVGSRLFAFSNRRLGTNSRMLVIRDGIQATDESADLSTYTVQDIQSIEVLRSGAHLNVYGPAGANGVLVITTKSGGLSYNDRLLNKENTVMAAGILYGYARSTEFYAPDFGNVRKGVANSPFTVCWLPNVVTGENGQATIRFFNSTNPGKYKVVAEGISEDGKPGRQVFYYEVK